MSDDCNHEMVDLELYERLFRDKNKKKEYENDKIC